MGMDVYGTREDTYFRNNVWWWRPLWAYVGDVCDLSEKDYQWGCSNDGHYISKKKANKIATTLFKEVKSKRTHDYMLSRNKRLKSLNRQHHSETNYGFDVNNVKRFAKFCKESDGFEIC